MENKIFNYLFIFLLVINITNAQWENITLDTKSSNLKDILVIDSSLIISSGDNGVIKTTKDAGTAWITSKIDKQSRQLNALAKNDEKIMIAGNSGCLMKSDLSANKWEIIELGLKNDFMDLALFGNYGVIIGDNGFLLLSSNKGNNWEQTKIIIDGTEIENNFIKVTFNKSGKLVICGNQGLLIYSVDFGKSFNKLDLSITDNLTALTDNDDGSILVGTDNIKLIQIDSTLLTYKLIASNNLPQQFYSLKAIGDSIIIAGVVNNLDLVQTISYDHGINWYFSNTYTFANGITRYKNQIYICMNSGNIFRLDYQLYKYSNNFQYLGEIIESGNPKISYQKVSGNYSDKLISFDNSNIYQTAKANIEWKKVFKLNISGYSLKDVQFTSEGNIIALIDSEYYANGMNHFYPKIIKVIEENSFKTVFETNEDMLIQKLITKPNENSIILLSNKHLLISANNGNSFDSLIVPDIKSFSRLSGGITSENMLYFVVIDKNGNYYLHKTYDLQNFEKTPLPVNIKNVYLINKDIGFNLNYVFNENQYIYKTIDGGSTFQNIFSYKLDASTGNLSDISFIDENYGVVCGANGVVYYTDNGGDNWYDIKNPAMNPSVKIYFPNKNELYISDGQNIYKYVDELPNSVFDGDYGSDLTSYLLYPNPTSEKLTLSQIPDGAVSYEIFDIFGERVLPVETIHELSQQNIDVSGLPTGVYFLKLNNQPPLKFIKL